MKNFNNVEDFFAEYEKSCNDYVQAGGTLEQEEKIRYLIKALPASYAQIGDFLDMIPKEQQTVEFVKMKIKEKNLVCKDSEKNVSASTFSTKIKGSCHYCSKPGHMEKDCWAKFPNLKPQKQQRGGYRGRSSRGGNSQRGSCRGRGGYNNDQQQQQQKQNSSPSEHSVWGIEVNHSKVLSDNCEKKFKNKSEVKWLLDSGCTNHIINCENYYYKSVVLKEPIDVNLPDGKILKATKIGNIKLFFKNLYNESYVELKNVYYVEHIRENILSLSKIANNYTIVAKKNDAKIYDTEKRKLITVAEKINDLYYINSFLNNELFTNSIKITEKEKWHRNLGHVNFEYLEKLVKNKLLNGLPKNLEKMEIKCANCLKSKMANLPFDNEPTTETSEILELVHTDLNGPYSTTGYGGEKYFLKFIDDFSKCTMTYCIKTKDQTANCFEEYINFVENQFDKKIKKLKCDNGTEYLNKRIYEFVRNKRIELLLCPPHVHELNGVSERYNRSAMDIGRCLMREARMN